MPSQRPQTQAEFDAKLQAFTTWAKSLPAKS